METFSCSITWCFIYIYSATADKNIFKFNFIECHFQFLIIPYPLHDDLQTLYQLHVLNSITFSINVGFTIS